MKKLLCLAICLMIMLLFAVPIHAQSNDSDLFYYECFADQYLSELEWLEDVQYNEVYYHYTNDSGVEVIDWALVYGYVYGPTPRNCYAVIGDRLSLQGECSPFAVNYAVYDVVNQKFIDICDIKDFSVYSDLENKINELELGLPIGDCDFDGALTILDATLIQSALASLCDFSLEDDLNEYYAINQELKYVSDIDRDGNRTIMDATAIQMKLAKIA